MSNAGINTDREIWRERDDDYYADSIHVTEQGGIGMNCGGNVIVLPIRRWHELAKGHPVRNSTIFACGAIFGAIVLLLYEAASTVHGLLTSAPSSWQGLLGG